MAYKTRLILLYGGKSGEHEVSLESAASVLANLDSQRYQITPVGVDKNGCYFINHYDEMLGYKHALPVQTQNSIPLKSFVVDGRLALAADVVFPMVHGPLYEDGCLQGVLQLADVAYVGSGVIASAVGMDKDLTKRLASLYHINTAKYRMISWPAHGQNIKEVARQIADELSWPLFVKPCSMGSSVGIHKARNMSELLEAIDDARQYDLEILIEETIAGREIELAVLENRSPSMPPDVSVAGEVRVQHPDGFYSYTAKYLESKETELVVPAQLDESVLHRLQQAAAALFNALKCRGMARVDFFVNDQTQAIYFNEINTLPGFTTISMYPKLWQASGLPYSQLLDQLIELAMADYKRRQQLVTHYQ